MLKVIKGGLEIEKEKKEARRQKLEDIYFRIFAECVENNDLHKAAFFGVKFFKVFNRKQIKTIDELNDYLYLNALCDYCISTLTIKEFINMFPIKKDFDGKRFCSKDYFSTIEYLSQFDEDETIGDRVEEICWNYYNSDIMLFGVNSIMLVDMERKSNGQMSIMEQFATENNVATYTIHEKEGYVYNNLTGKTMPYKPEKKKRNSNIRLV